MLKKLSLIKIEVYKWFLKTSFSNLSQTEIIFLIIGFLGQGLFASRFIYQWIYSEKKEKVLFLLVFGI